MPWSAEIEVIHSKFENKQTQSHTTAGNNHFKKDLK